MDNSPLPEVDPALVRMLRLLVTVLSVVMIVGFIVLIALFVIRFTDRQPSLPSEITLPAGDTATAFTRGDGWNAVVTEDQQILIFDSVSGALVQTIDVVTSR
jgi:hypothetical protein